MKKKLLALAVAGALAPAFAVAQTSNVTLSGQLKLGYEYIDTDGARGGTAGYNNIYRIANETSWVRLSGSEDLGNGLRAVFQIESEINGDVQGGLWTSRNSGVGLASNTLGTLMFGRWDAHYTSHAAVEGAGFGGNALALKANSLNLLQWVNGLGTAGSRLSNVIRYVSPTWAGFSGEVIYSLDSEPAGTSSSSVQSSSGQRGRPSEWAITLRWGAGPANAFLSYINRHNQGLVLANYGGGVPAYTGALPTTLSDAAAAGLGGGLNGNALSLNQGTLDLEAYRFGGSYTFGFGGGMQLKVGAIGDYNKWNADIANNTSNINAKRWAMAIPASLAMGPHTIFATFGYAWDTKGNVNCNTAIGGVTARVGCSGGDTSAQMYMIGYDYALSKRTSVGGNWVMINNDTNAYYDFWTRGIGVGAAGTATATGGGASPQSFYVGIRHLF
ncbi:MAG: porin [Burkholderiales bacterium]|nr:porin [Burkholderiales bacterium]